MVADDRLTKYRLWSACEPTGMALVVNSFTTARRIACFLFSISFSALCPAECQLEYDQRYLVVEVHSAPSWKHAAVAALDQSLFNQLAKLLFESFGRRSPFGGAQPQHQGLAPGLACREL